MGSGMSWIDADAQRDLLSWEVLHASSFHDELRRAAVGALGDVLGELLGLDVNRVC